MKLTGSILITGITGSLGSSLAGLILKDGFFIKSVVRGDNQLETDRRVQKSLEIASCRTVLDNVKVLLGDVCQDNLGISVEELEDVSLIIHSAAQLDFSDESSQMNYEVNVNGTGNVLKLAKEYSIPFCYISTAYVAGKRRGIVREDELDVGQDFHNSYESTKCTAEQQVRQWSETTGLKSFIFRPSILVGDSGTGRIVNFDGMYNLLHFFDNIAEMARNEEFRAVANPEATKNLIPVDIASKMIWKILKNGRGGVYHITNPEPISLARLADIFIELFNMQNAGFVSEEEFRLKKPSRLERLYQRASSVYEPYLRDEPIFDRTETQRVLNDSELEFASIDLEFFKRLLSYAQQVNWGKDRAALSLDSNCRYSRIIEDYFSRFLTSKMNSRLLPDLHNLSATCRICVSDIPQKGWSLEIKQGCLETISLNGLACQCTFYTDGETFEKIVTGKLAPQKAFFRKKIDIDGNIETGLKLATVLAAFFRKFPYIRDENNG